MCIDRASTVAFSGHRTYCGDVVLRQFVGTDGAAFRQAVGASDSITAAEALHLVVEELYRRGFRTFLCGMAVGFDLAAAEAVLALRERVAGTSRSIGPHPPRNAETWCAHAPQLIAVVPFSGQERRFSSADRARFDRVSALADHRVVLSPGYHAGCYAVRNNYLVDNASLLVAWYNGSKGGTHYTVRRALRKGLKIRNLCPCSSDSASARNTTCALGEPMLF